MSIRFIPAPSPWSIGASAPTSSEAKNELTRCTRPVAAYATGSVSKNRRIWGPVKRSMAREPVSRATASSPPSRAVMAAHCAPVLASIQTGASGRLNSGATCGARAERGIQAAQSVLGAGPEVHAAMLLPRTRHPGQPAQVEARLPGEERHHAVERVGPEHGRRGDDEGIGVPQDPGMGPVGGKVAIEVEGTLPDGTPVGAVYRDDDRAEALGAGVESEVKGHERGETVRREA